MNIPADGTPCDKLQDHLRTLFPDMTFQVRQHQSPLPGYRIYGQHTRNMRYDRPNHFAAFDLSNDAYNAIDKGSGAESLLRSAVAELEIQLRLREK